VHYPRPAVRRLRLLGLLMVPVDRQ